MSTSASVGDKARATTDKALGDAAPRTPRPRRTTRDVCRTRTGVSDVARCAPTARLPLERSSVVSPATLSARAC